MQTIDELMRRVKSAILNANAYNSKLSNDIITMDGMSSKKIKHFLNNICSNSDVVYLEVGTGTGSTFCSAMYNNDIIAYACDAWLESKLGTDGRKTFLENYNKHINKKHGYTLIDGDCFSLDLSLIKDKINVYFYDAGHEKEDHEKSLTYFEQILDDRCIMIIDDWNDEDVQNGTIDGLNKAHFLVKHQSLCSVIEDNITYNNEHWWNGLQVFVLERSFDKKIQYNSVFVDNELKEQGGICEKQSSF